MAQPTGPLDFGGFIGPFFPGRRARKNALLQAEAGRIMAERASVGADQLQADTDADRRFNAALQVQLQTAKEWMASPDANMRALGQQRVMQIHSQVLSQIQQNEQQALAERVAETELGETLYNRFRQLSTDLRRESADFVQQRDSYGRILASAVDPSAAGDLALIFNYMKVLDPGSTVREGEFATARNAGGIDERIRALYNNILTGQVLEEPQRADFVHRAGNLFAQARADQIRRNTLFMERARDASVPDKYLDTLPIPVSPAEVEYLPPPQARVPTGPEELTPGAELQPPSVFARGIDAIAAGATRIAGDVRRLGLDVELYRELDGTLKELASDGTVRTVGRDTIFERDGQRLRLVERGGGRYEWVPVGVTREQRNSIFQDMMRQP